LTERVETQPRAILADRTRWQWRCIVFERKTGDTECVIPQISLCSKACGDVED